MYSEGENEADKRGRWGREKGGRGVVQIERGSLGKGRQRWGGVQDRKNSFGTEKWGLGGELGFFFFFQLHTSHLRSRFPNSSSHLAKEPLRSTMAMFPLTHSSPLPNANSPQPRPYSHPQTFSTLFSVPPLPHKFMFYTLQISSYHYSNNPHLIFPLSPPPPKFLAGLCTFWAVKLDPALQRYRIPGIFMLQEQDLGMGRE